MNRKKKIAASLGQLVIPLVTFCQAKIFTLKFIVKSITFP